MYVLGEHMDVGMFLYGCGYVSVWMWVCFFMDMGMFLYANTTA